MIPLRYSTANQFISLGYVVSHIDGNTELGNSLVSILNTDIKLFKYGTNTVANKNSGNATAISGGIWGATLNGIDSNIVGPMDIYTHVTSALGLRREAIVYPTSIYDALIAGSSLLDINANLWRGSLLNALISGKVDASATVSIDSVVLADVARWRGQTVLVPDITGVPQTDLRYWRGSTVNALISGQVDSAASVSGNVTVSSILAGVIQGPSFSSGAITAIQDGLATRSQLASTISATVAQWRGSSVNALIAGRVDVNVGVSQTALLAIASSVASAAVAAIQLGLAPSAQTSTIDARLASVIRADVARWLGTTPTTPNIAGKPIVDLTHWRGSAVNELIAGQVDAQTTGGGNVTVSSILAGVITGPAFASGGITAIQNGLATTAQVASTLTATVSGTVTAVVPSTVNALVSSTVNANVAKINNVTVVGAGTLGNEWRP